MQPTNILVALLTAPRHIRYGTLYDIATRHTYDEGISYKKGLSPHIDGLIKLNPTAVLILVFTIQIPSDPKYLRMDPA